MSFSSSLSLWIATGCLLGYIQLSDGKFLNLIHLSDARNPVANTAVDYALKHIKKRASIYKIYITNFTRHTATDGDPRAFLIDLCESYDFLLNNHLPIVVLDTTVAAAISSAAKAFSWTLALPTVSTTPLDKSNPAGRYIDNSRRNCLVEILAPTTILPRILRLISLKDEHKTRMILHDTSFVIDLKDDVFKNLNVTKIDSLETIETAVTSMHEFNESISLVLFCRQKITQIILNKICDYQEFLIGMNLWIIGKGWELPLVNCSLNLQRTYLGTPESLWPYVFRERKARRELSKHFEQENESEIDHLFYFSLTVRVLLAAEHMVKSGAYPENKTMSSCKNYNWDYQHPAIIPDIRTSLIGEDPEQLKSNGFRSSFVVEENKTSFMDFAVQFDEMVFHKGGWFSKMNLAKYKISETFNNDTKTVHNPLRIVTVLQAPFMMKKDDNVSYMGYCIDLFDKIIRLTNITLEYEIFEVDSFGFVDGNGKWDGLMRALIDDEADIALGSLQLTAERAEVVDFTATFYEPVGFTILMKKHIYPPLFWSYIEIMDLPSWSSVLLCFAIQCLFIWGLDKKSPFSYRNDIVAYESSPTERVIFDFKTTLWFCFTNLTPQGGGNMPKNTSSRALIGLWWMYGFVFMASYTANLAALLTVSQLDVATKNLNDLVSQYKIQFAPHENSSAAKHFERQGELEALLYDEWKKMALNKSLRGKERSKFSVWEYPLGDKHSKMWMEMLEFGLNKTIKEAIERVLKSKSTYEGFAYIGDGTDIRWEASMNCDLQIIGEDFAAKPYAIALQKGSKLTDKISAAIQHLQDIRYLDVLKDKWWKRMNPKQKDCTYSHNFDKGLDLNNLGGLFVTILISIAISLTVLIFEYYYYRMKPVKVNTMHIARELGRVAVESSIVGWTGEGTQNQAKPRRRFSFQPLPPVHEN